MENQRTKAGESLVNLILGRIRGLRPQQRMAPEQGLEYWRERILFGLVGTGVLLSAIAFVPGFFVAVKEGLWVMLLLNIGALIGGLALLTFRGVSYRIRASVALGVIYVVALYLLVFLGPLSGGPIWLFTFGIMSGLLLSLRAAIIGVWINTVTLAVLGWLFYSGYLGKGLPFFESTLRAVAAGGNFIFMNAAAAVSCALLIRGLHVIASKEQSISQSLEHEKAQLVEAKKRLEEEIASREETERLLRDSEHRYRLLAENVSDVIWTLRLDTMRFDYISQSVLRARGFTPEEAMELSLEKTLAPQFLENVTRALAEELARDGQEGVDPNRCRTMELQQLLKDGSPAWAEVTMTFIRNDEGRPVEILGVTRDIRERKRAEEEKKKLEARLEEARKMEAIANLAGGVAHQFNNALNVITLSLDGLKMDLPGDERTGQYVIGMQGSAERMSRLTNQLLAYARGGKYRPTIVPMGELMVATLPLVKHTIRASIRLDKKIPDGLWSVEVDETQIQMALSAILANASEAIEGDGIIEISCRNEEVTGQGKEGDSEVRPGRYVVLAVADNGKGMDEQTRRKVFDPFFTTKFQGRGLGMSAVYGIVTNHGGSILVDSAIGKGTTVQIYLPCVEEHPRPAIGAKIESEEKSKTILLIEDEAMLMGLLRTSLERFGYRVLEAPTGKEAVNEARTFEGIIHLAILDMVLPDIDSREVYRTVKKIRPDMKVLLMSGYSVDGPAQDLLEAGAEAFLQKPFTIDTLSEKLREIQASKT
jgi:PAS domain S-box-containing protein